MRELANRIRGGWVGERHGRSWGDVTTPLDPPITSGEGSGTCCTRRRIVLGLATVLLIFPARARADEVVFRDDFSGGQVLSGWGFIRENPQTYSLTSRSGFYRVQTGRGVFGEDGNVQNLLVRPITGDFILETRLEFDPQTAQQFGGLLVYEDDGHAVALGLGYASGDRGIFRGVVLLSVADSDLQDDRPADFYNEDTTDTPTVVFLRLLRSGDRFVGGYSSDGVTYTDVGTISAELPDAVRVGIGAANGDAPDCGGDCDISIAADFDFFQISTFDAGDDGTGGSVTLESLTVEGPAEVDENDEAAFTATASFSDGSELDVTDEAEWSLAPEGFGDIATGVLSAGNVDEDVQVTVVSSFTQFTSGGLVTRTDSLLVRVRAGGGSTGGASSCGAGLLPFLVIGLCLGIARGHS